MSTAHENESVGMIEARDLSKRFGAFTAVDQVSFKVERGEIFGLLGPNGAGKSTTIRMLCGLLRSTSGSARVGGFDINAQPERVRETIGYMSQKFSLYRDLTVDENINFFGGIYGLRNHQLHERREVVLRMAGLNGLEQHLTGTLSGALQQRLALGCAILHQPPILFLDEPTSGVDPISRRMFWDLIEEMARSGITILITTHFLDEAEFCNRIGFISSGKLVALNTPAKIKKEAVQEDVFELEIAAVPGTKERIQALPGIIAVSYFGPKLHVFAKAGLYTYRSLADLLTASGMTASSVRPAPVRLEDAFIRLVERTAA